MSGEAETSGEAESEDGSILPLVIVFLLISVVLVAVVAGATSLYLERKRLFALADGASYAGAESFDLDSVRLERGEPRATLTDAGVHRAAAAYLERAPRDRLDGLALVRASADGGSSATVVVRATWHPPVVAGILPLAVPLSVTSTARSVFD